MPAADTRDILERLVGFPSVFTAPDYSAITDFAVDHLKGLGFTCHRLAGAEPGRAGLFASLGPPGPGGVLLSAHLDVVPVEGQAWTLDPFHLSRANDRLYGRGTTDMKGFAAAALAAAARATERELKAPLKIAFSYDEEAGCVGIAEMIGQLEQSIGLPDLCLVGEPTRMQIATGHKGKVSYAVTLTGEAGHSAEAPNHLNALHLAIDFAAVLRRLQDEIATTGARDERYAIPYATIHVGRLAGGTSLNVVPARAELEFEIRHLAADDVSAHLDRIGREAEALVAQVRERFPAAGIAIEETNRYPGYDLPDDSRAEAFIRSVGGLGPAGKVNYGTDGGVFADELGLPVIVCGPGDMQQGHKPDEYIELSQLAACDRMLDRILDHLSGAGRVVL